MQQTGQPVPPSAMTVVPAPVTHYGTMPAPVTHYGTMPALATHYGTMPAPTTHYGAMPAPAANYGTMPAPTTHHGTVSAPPANYGTMPAPTTHHGTVPALAMHYGTSTPTAPTAPTSVFFRPFPQRWGDMPAVAAHDAGIAAIEREAMTKPRSLAVEPMRLFQPTTTVADEVKQERKTGGLFEPKRPMWDEARPSDEDSKPAVERHSKSQLPVVIDPRTIHTIQLLQYARKLRVLLAEHGARTDAHDDTTPKRPRSSSPPQYVAPPPLPPFEAPHGPNLQTDLKPTFPFHHPASEGDFQRGSWKDGLPPPSISTATCRQLLRRTIHVIIAHAGFDTASEAAIDLLTDVLHSYLTQLGHQLREAKDQEVCGGRRTDGFPDIIEKVFYDVGVGSTADLLSHHKRRVLDYHTNMQLQCQSLLSQYEGLTWGKGGTKKCETDIKTESKSWFSEATANDPGIQEQTHSAMTHSAMTHSAMTTLQTSEGSSSAFLSPELRHIPGTGSHYVLGASEIAASHYPTSGMTSGMTGGMTSASVMESGAFNPVRPMGTSSTVTLIGHSPTGAVVADVTDYDAEDEDDVITEPSSVKSMFETDCTPAHGHDALGGVASDHVTAAMSSLTSPGHSKKKKKTK